MYYYEIEQKERLNGRVTIPIAILSLLVGLVIYYFKSLKDIEVNGWGIAFFILYGLFFLSILICGYLIFKATYNYEYHYLPDPVTLQNDTDKIIDYFESNYDKYYQDAGEKSKLISKDIDEMMFNYYKDFTTQNIQMNKKKVTYSRYLGYATVIALLLALLTVFPFQVSFKDDKINKVEVQDIDKVIEEFKKIKKGEIKQ